MSVDISLLTEIDRWLETIEKTHGGDLGMDNLKSTDYWRDLSKNASYALPSLLGESLKWVFTMREELVKLEVEPSTLITTQKQVIDLQAELLQCKNDQLQALHATVRTSVEDTVKAEFQTYSNGVQKKIPQQAISQEIVLEGDRSRSLIVFNLPEEEEDQDQLCSKVGEVLQELGENPEIEASRLGTPDDIKARPIRVKLSNSVAVGQILSKAMRLRTSEKYKSVFIRHDRSPEERALHRLLLLVEQLKKRSHKSPAVRQREAEEDAGEQQ